MGHFSIDSVYRATCAFSEQTNDSDTVKSVTFRVKKPYDKQTTTTRAIGEGFSSIKFLNN